MIEKDDVRAAVAAGLINEKQASSLIALSQSRTGARSDLAAGDEPFELFKGFNEIFIVIGLLILSFGWALVMGLFVGSQVISGAGSNAVGTIAAAGILTAAAYWLLSEYFVRKRRMVAPAIALSVMFAMTAALTLIAIFAEPFMTALGDFSTLVLPFLLGTLILFGYWWRFRVPFAMALIAIGLFMTTLLWVATRSTNPESISDIFLLSAGGTFAWVTLILGFGVFVVAMMFDMSDPHRVTRRSANGFWLHVVAAPALVNTVALSLLAQESGGSNALLFVLLMFFALVAVVIDRRSFLIAAIGYIVTLAAVVFDGEGAAFTVLALGVVLLLLGAFWERIRARILRMMPFLPLDRLPPSTAGTL